MLARYKVGQIRLSENHGAALFIEQMRMKQNVISYADFFLLDAKVIVDG